MEQIECPKCGASGIKLMQQRMLRNERGKLVPAWQFHIWFLIAMMLFLGLMAALFISMFVAMHDSSWLVMAVLLLVGFILMPVAWFKQNARSSTWPLIIKCECQVCGRKFEVEPGAPRPESQASPDLLRLGAQKLERDLEEQRRRNDR